MKLKIALPALMIALASIFCFTFRPTAADGDGASQAAFNKYYSQINQSLSELNLNGDSGQAVENLSNYFYSRSGERIPNSSRQRLVELEEAVRKGQLPSATPEILAKTMTESAFEVLSGMTDEEIEQTVETMTGFKSSDIPAGVSRHTVKFRSSIGSSQTPTEISRRSKALKSPEAQLVAKDFAKRTILDFTKKRLTTFSVAAPQTFRESLSPLQAVLLTYSVAADDAGLPTSEVNRQMDQIHAFMTKKYGHYPFPQGNHAFGRNGYVFATPLHVLFQENNFNGFLNRLESNLKGGKN